MVPVRVRLGSAICRGDHCRRFLDNEFYVAKVV